MVQAILKARSSFAGLSSVDYTYVKITNHVMVKKVSKEKAEQIIEDNNLSLVYHNIYGKIYSEESFKILLTNNKKFRYEVFKELEAR